MQAPGHNVQTASDAPSIARYQASIYSKLDLLNKAPTEVLDLARAFLAIHKDPILRFTGVDLQLAALDVTDQNTVLSLDLVDVVTVQKSFSVGTPASVSEPLIVSGISHTIRPGDHRIKLTFEHLDSRSFLTLDNDPLGKLNQNYLYF
jgi:outer membrane lipopolysaccharide assembly protein LptE/RlpB